MKIGLISYPRSGSNWVNFCIEHILRISSIGSTKEYKIWCRSNVKEFIEGYELIKSHTFNFEMDKLVFVIRDYKECISRDTKTESLIERSLPRYIDLLKMYDVYDKPKIIVYYEDLITKSEYEITKFCRFIKEPSREIIEDFFFKFEDYRQQSLSKYSNFTNGLVVKSHSNLLSDGFKKHLDCIVKKEKELFERYLKRYEERSIN
jgi:hypothetical protein